MVTGAKWAGMAQERENGGRQGSRRRTGPAEDHTATVVPPDGADPEILRPLVANEAMKRSSALGEVDPAGGQHGHGGHIWSEAPRAAGQSGTGAPAMAVAKV